MYFCVCVELVLFSREINIFSQNSFSLPQTTLSVDEMESMSHIHLTKNFFLFVLCNFIK